MNYSVDLPDRHSFADLDVGRTHYRIDGPPEGRLLLLIHGATVPAWEFDRLVPYLNQAGFQTIRADLLGHGYSDRPGVIYDVDLFRDQMLMLLDYLEIEEPIDILGHSLGSAIGAALINHSPSRFDRLILAAPLVNFMANMPVLNVFKVPLLGELLTRWYTIPMLKRRRTKRYGPIEDGRFVAKFHTQFLIPGIEKALLSLFRHGVLGDQSSRYRRLHMAGNGCLIIRGSDDEIVTSRQIDYLKMILRDAEHIDIKDTPHSFLLTHPELVAPAINDYLKSDSV